MAYFTGPNKSVKRVSRSSSDTSPSSTPSPSDSPSKSMPTWIRIFLAILGMAIFLFVVYLFIKSLRKNAEEN